MIDTDKYEGHTEGPWHIENEENNGMRLFICSKDATILWQCETTHADALLVADAPLLLEEVKRLRKIEQEHGRVIIDDWEHKPLGDADAYPLPYVTVYHGGCEYVGRLRLYKNEDGKVIE